MLSECYSSSMLAEAGFIIRLQWLIYTCWVLLIPSACWSRVYIQPHCCGSFRHAEWMLLIPNASWRRIHNHNTVANLHMLSATHPQCLLKQALYITTHLWLFYTCWVLLIPNICWSWVYNHTAVANLHMLSECYSSPMFAEAVSITTLLWLIYTCWVSATHPQCLLKQGL